MKALPLLVPALLSGFALRAQTSPPDSTREAAQVFYHDGRIEPMLRMHEEWKRANPTQPGYRVQLYNGNKADAQKVRAQFVRTFPDAPVYLTYETPEYRVQAGDFRDRFEAEKALRLWLPAFAGAFVVPARIQWPLLPEPTASR